MQMLKKVSHRRQVAVGYSQSAYITDYCEILLNHLTTEAKLGKHVHEFAQFGYCFEGVFLFDVEDEQFTCSKGKAYDISGNLEHGAVVVEDILALDFKYQQNSKKQEKSIIKFNAFNQKNVYENEDIKVNSFHDATEDHGIMSYKNYKENYVLSLKEQNLEVNGQVFQIEKNEIYSIQVETDILNLKLDKQPKLFLLQLKQS